MSGKIPKSRSKKRPVVPVSQQNSILRFTKSGLDPFRNVPAPVIKPQSKLEDFFGPNPQPVRTTPARVEPISLPPRFRDPNTGADYERELQYVAFSNVYLTGNYDLYRQKAIDYLDEERSSVTPQRVAMYASIFFEEDQRKIALTFPQDFASLLKSPE